MFARHVGLLCSHLLYKITLVTSYHFTIEYFHTFKFSCNPVTFNEGPCNKNWFQNVQLGCLYLHTEFERNRFIRTQTEANVEDRVYKVT